MQVNFQPSQMLRLSTSATFSLQLKKSSASKLEKFETAILGSLQPHMTDKVSNHAAYGLQRASVFDLLTQMWPLKFRNCVKRDDDGINETWTIDLCGLGCGVRLRVLLKQAAERNIYTQLGTNISLSLDRSNNNCSFDGRVLQRE